MAQVGQDNKEKDHHLRGERLHKNRGGVISVNGRSEIKLGVDSTSQHDGILAGIEKTVPIVVEEDKLLKSEAKTNLGAETRSKIDALEVKQLLD